MREEGWRLRRAKARIDRAFRRALEDEHQERTIETLKLAVMYALAYVLAVAIMTLLLAGCRAALPTASTEGREHRMLEYLQCFADHQGLEGYVHLSVFDGTRTYCGSDRKCGYVACAAWPNTMEVECWRRFLHEGTDAEFREAASHEVCHLKGIHNEDDAAACGWEAVYGKGVCP